MNPDRSPRLSLPGAEADGEPEPCQAKPTGAASGGTTSLQIDLEPQNHWVVEENGLIPVKFSGSMLVCGRVSSIVFQPCILTPSNSSTSTVPMLFNTSLIRSAQLSSWDEGQQINRRETVHACPCISITRLPASNSKVIPRIELEVRSRSMSEVMELLSNPNSKHFELHMISDRLLGTGGSFRLGTGSSMKNGSQW